jgi:hypothetical protein
MPGCKSFLFISADAAQEEENKKKVLLLTGVPKSAVHTVCCVIAQIDYIFIRLIVKHITEGKFLVTKFEFGENFGMSLEGVCYEL